MAGFNSRFVDLNFADLFMRVERQDLKRGGGVCGISKQLDVGWDNVSNSTDNDIT